MYLKPNFALLKKSQIWVDAFSQIFFTLSLAFGIMITYASYLPRKVNIVKDAYYISIGNCLFSFFSGFAVFGTLGYMAHTLGKPVEEVVKESIGLAFVTYPQAISLMPAFSKIFGVVFFSSLVIAGLSSAISLVEAFSSAVIDKFHYPRKIVVSVVCVTGFLGSIIFSAQSGLLWVDIVDHFITHYGLVIVAVLECFVVALFFKTKKLREHINHSGDIVMNKFWDIAICYVSPLVLIVLLINDLRQEIAAPYGGYPRSSLIAIGHGWLLFTLITAFLISMRSWRRELNQHE